MNPDSYSITYLTGAGMMVDLTAWILIGLGILATSFSIGLLLAVARKRRIAKIQRVPIHETLELKNWTKIDMPIGEESPNKPSNWYVEGFSEIPRHPSIKRVIFEAEQQEGGEFKCRTTVWPSKASWSDVDLDALKWDLADAICQNVGPCCARALIGKP